MLVGKTDDYTKNQIAVNITSNLLGMGNASTPSGINAIAGLDKGYKYATKILYLCSLRQCPNQHMENI